MIYYHLSSLNAHKALSHRAASPLRSCLSLTDTCQLSPTEAQPLGFQGEHYTIIKGICACIKSFLSHSLSLSFTFLKWLFRNSIPTSLSRSKKWLSRSPDLHLTLWLINFTIVCDQTKLLRLLHKAVHVLPLNFLISLVADYPLYPLRGIQQVDPSLHVCVWLS